MVKMNYFLGFKIWEEKRGRCVGWESVDQWKGEWMVSAYRVKNYNADSARKALDYVTQFIRRRFEFFVTKTKWIPERWEMREIRLPLPFGVIRIRVPVWIPSSLQLIFRPVRKAEDDYWYCTKVVYRAWLSQGVNIEYSGGRRDDFVFPDDMKNSINDGTIYHINGNDPWNP